MDAKLAKSGFIKAYIQSFGNITQSCKAVGIVRQTFYNWKESDEEFRVELNNLEPEENFLDFLETKLIAKINKGDTACLIFALKTKAKKRGYIERTEVVNSGKTVIEIEDDIDYSKLSDEVLTAIDNAKTFAD